MPFAFASAAWATDRMYLSMPLTHFSLRVVRNLVYSRRPSAPEPRSPDRLRAGAPERPYARAIRSPAASVVRSLGSRLTPREAPTPRSPERPMEP